jgi:tRNA modification GTPase
MPKGKLASQGSPDTIAAQATAPGRGGIAIVRVSGPLVTTIMRDLLGKTLEARKSSFLPFKTDTNEIIDEGIAIFYPAPHSFTGEDVLELHGHGSPVVVDMLLQRIIQLGARIANPGEFSLRAFLNDKIDLSQAEAIADLIDASSREAARLALQSLQGVFAKKIHALNEKIIHLRMYVEAAIDFAEEEIDFLSAAHLQHDFANILQDLNVIQQEAHQGSLFREGLTVAIAGQPNVGKSSLLNSLSKKDSAIVTPIPGTTRDVLREHILLDGIPLHIVDTAGLRETQDLVEQEGIRRAYAEFAKADIILYVIEANNTAAQDIPDIFSPQKTLVIHNKIDLLNLKPRIDSQHIYLSAKNGEGLELLVEQIKKQVGVKQHGEGIFLARRRHLDALARAKEYLISGLQQLIHKAGELAAEDLRLAQRCLNEITGEFSSDDLLGKIFASFCIGK